MRARGIRSRWLRWMRRTLDIYGRASFRLYALGPGFLKYSYCARLVPWLRENARKFDIVIVNGIWQYQSFAVQHVLRDGSVPYVVYTHGMLDPWFKQRYPLKHLKKMLYWPGRIPRAARCQRRFVYLRRGAGACPAIIPPVPLQRGCGEVWDCGPARRSAGGVGGVLRKVSAAAGEAAGGLYGAIA